jgi:hypothetical protein
MIAGMEANYLRGTPARHDALFCFEQDFAAALQCIPMAVRFKLDLAGIKVSLRQWSCLEREQRETLLRTPCESLGEVGDYRAHLLEMLTALSLPIETIALDAAPAWAIEQMVPEQVVRFAEGAAIAPPTHAQWSRLSVLQRFVLLKLSLAKHDNVNFVPALREFGLCP